MNINRDDIVHLMRNMGNIQAAAFSEIMGEILSKEAEVGWEMGPEIDDERRTYLALTCWGDMECLEAIKSDLSLPIIEGSWSIVAGSPRKNWDRYFEMDCDDRGVIGVEAGVWKWKLNSRSSKVANLDIYMDKDYGEYSDRAAALFLIGELGEWFYGSHVALGDVRNLKDSDASALEVEQLRPSMKGWFPDIEI